MATREGERNTVYLFYYAPHSTDSPVDPHCYCNNISNIPTSVITLSLTQLHYMYINHYDIPRHTTQDLHRPDRSVVTASATHKYRTRSHGPCAQRHYSRRTHDQASRVGHVNSNILDIRQMSVRRPSAACQPDRLNQLTLHAVHYAFRLPSSRCNLHVVVNMWIVLRLSRTSTECPPSG